MKLLFCALVVIGTVMPVYAQPNISDVSDTAIYTGTASYYHQNFEGRRTASGEVYHNKKMTAASNKLPLGTQVKVVNKKNGKWVKVRINDRMSKHNNRLIDLSRKAAKELNMIHQGLIKVKVIAISP